MSSALLLSLTTLYRVKIFIFIGFFNHPGSQKTTGTNQKHGDVTFHTIQQYKTSAHHNTGSKSAIKLQHLTYRLNVCLLYDVLMRPTLLTVLCRGVQCFATVTAQIRTLRLLLTRLKTQDRFLQEECLSPVNATGVTARSEIKCQVQTSLS